MRDVVYRACIARRLTRDGRRDLVGSLVMPGVVGSFVRGCHQGVVQQAVGQTYSPNHDAEDLTEKGDFIFWSEIGADHAR